MNLSKQILIMYYNIFIYYFLYPIFKRTISAFPRRMWPEIRARLDLLPETIPITDYDMNTSNNDFNQSKKVSVGNDNVFASTTNMPILGGNNPFPLMPLPLMMQMGLAMAQMQAAALASSGRGNGTDIIGGIQGSTSTLGHPTISGNRGRGRGFHRGRGRF